MGLQLNQKNELKDYAINLVEKYVLTLHKMGLKNVVGTYCDYDIIRNQVDDQALKRLISHLKPAITTINSLENEVDININEQSEKYLLKRFMFLSQLDVDYNLDEILDDYDVIEVYDLNHIQMYRSFNFFRYCSYSLEEIFTSEWWRLFERSVFVTKKIIKVSNNVFGNQVKEIQQVNCPDHWVYENCSKHRFGCYIRQKILIPLLNEKKQVAAALTPFQVVKYSDQEGNILNVKRSTVH